MTIIKTYELVEKWSTCWADGEFTYEETETILQAAGYFKYEYGGYQDNNGNGDFYSYEEFRKLLMNGEEIPYAPKVDKNFKFLYKEEEA